MNTDSIAAFRVVKAGFTNFSRNFWLSATATLVMVITLIILTLTAFVYNVTNVASSQIQKRVDISVYMKPEVSEQQILAIKSKLEQLPQVASVNYVSKDQALASFKDFHTKINDQVPLAALEQLDTNPFPATLQVKTKQLQQYQQVADTLNQADYQPYIESVNFEKNKDVIDRLSRILGMVKKVGSAVAIALCAIAALVIFNTIRLTIYNRREEVEIMKLVGATNWYIRWPFIIESVLYAFVASVITIIITVPIFHYLLPRLSSFIGASLTDYRYAFNLGIIFLAQLIVALLLGIGSSLIAIRRYLRV